jgi:hypothetical protein
VPRVPTGSIPRQRECGSQVDPNPKPSDFGLPWSKTGEVLAVFCGEVSGALRRSLLKAEDSSLVVRYRAAIVGVTDTDTDTDNYEDVVCDSAEELRIIAGIAGLLADEMDQRMDTDETAP